MENIGFYVTATDAGKYFPMFGPVDTKAGAEAIVEPVSWLARKIDPSGRANFMGWGVTAIGHIGFFDGIQQPSDGQVI